MPRKTPEWIGKTDDSKCPREVLDRIFIREGGRCHICGGKIHAGEKWDGDHVIELWEGGENRESNIKPAHKETCHKKKSAKGAAKRAKEKRVRQKHNGIIQPKGTIKSGGFKPAAKQGSATRPLSKTLPKRKVQMFQKDASQ